MLDIPQAATRYPGLDARLRVHDALESTRIHDPVLDGEPLSERDRLGEQLVHRLAVGGVNPIEHQ